MLEASISLLLANPSSVLSVSDSIEEMLGYPAESFISHHVSLKDLIHPHDADISEMLFSTDPSDNSSGVFNIRIRQANGRIRCLKGSFKKQSAKVETGIILELLLQDAKSLKRTLDEAVAMPNFRAMMDNTDDYIYFKDRNHVFTGASQTLVSLCHPAEHWTDLIGKTDYDVFPEEYADIYYRLEKQVFSGMPLAHEIQETLTNDGKKGWVDNRKYPINDENGEIIGLYGIARDVTENKNTEDALKASEERFKNVLQDVSSIAVQGYAPDGTTQYWNHASELLYGYTAQEAIGRNLVDLIIPPEIRADVEQAITYMAESGQAIPSAELSLRRKDGSMVTVFSSHVIVKIPGRNQELFCLDIDLSELKQKEMELRDSKELFSLFMKYSPIYTFIKQIEDNQSRVIEVSDNFIELAGKTAEELRGCTMDEIFPPEFAGKITADDISVVNEGKVIQLEEDLNGNSYSTIKFPIIREGKSSLLAGFTINITDRKQAEEAMRRNESYYRSIFDNSLVGVAVSDENYVFTDVNDAYCRLLGYAKEELIGIKRISDVSHPEDAEKSVEMIRKLQNKELTEYTLEKRYVSKSGKTIPVMLFVKGNYSQDGRFEGSTGSVLDLSEHLLAEREKHDLEQQLLQAQKLESLGVLAGGIAHDFNNILAVIIGRCALAKMNYSNADKHIPDIEKAAERAADLCRQMLAYAGKTDFIVKDINLGILVDDMVTMLRATINQNVKINLSLPATIPVITGDESQIRQIVTNLIINSSEAIGEVQGNVFVSVAKEYISAESAEKDCQGNGIAPGWYVLLEVSDDGCGMDAETKNRIFEPFFTTKFTGRGLGMSAVLGIIKAHQGALQLESAKGLGTTFKVYLPIQNNGQSEVLPFLQSAEPEPWRSSGTILLVEDEEQVASVAQAMLEELGFSVMVASNGVEALQQYQDNVSAIALVITDIGMPIMDGYELFSRLKTLNPKVPIIISSGFGDSVITSRIPTEEIAGLISKPYNFIQLCEVLKECCKQ
ncbi:MAG: PAS domain S-box protein [Desulfuromonadaceae bacterium]|nr:PAS domain S-box protein [Desulfuromonadaceae bacterium]MDD2849621.1 PAS domain S-box protein [Desulfuromonadaceae bacterium]MDD4130920.1 PAS domain S-box protein [Desulfuromonadaceae bacterium]